MARSNYPRYRRGYHAAGCAGLLLAALMAAFVMLPGCKPSEPTCPPQPKPPPAQKQPEPAAEKLPRLELQPLTGDSQPVTLEELRGRVVLINFWGTWCPPCRVELPHIADIEKKFRDNPAFKPLAVSCTYKMREDVAALRDKTSKFLQQVDIDMPTYADQGGTTRLAAKSAGAFSDGYPTTLLLDRQGGIRKVWVGYGPGVEKEIEKLISQLLEEK